ncbi:MAG: hypothetical protein O7G85_17185, partial [Planctomycetota bacterium]|nr:hypothetical protein [Planctomycetota bacterium]
NFDSLVDNVVGLSLNEHGQQRARYMLTQKEKLETFISKTVGLKVKVTLDVSSGVRVAAKPVSGTMIDEVQDIPIVRRAMDLFDATVIDVRDDSRSATRDEK